MCGTECELLRSLKTILAEIQKTYKTVKEQSEGLYKEKGSKFIGYAVACYSEEEAKVYLEKWRKEHYQSRHVCWAYRFGLDKKQYRANDDGEPSNSAGIPILGQIQSFDLSNILIGVVRYFGGVKLGVGGLVQAYKETAKDALLNAEIHEIEVFHRVTLNFGYDVMPDVMSLLKKHEFQYDNQQFGLACAIDVAIPLDQLAIKTDLLEMNDLEIVEKGEY